MMTMDLLLPAALDLVVKATAVLTLAALAVLALRKRTAAERHLVWVAALVALVALPLAIPIAPGWELPGPRLSIEPVTSVRVDVGEDRQPGGSGTTVQGRVSDGSAVGRLSAGSAVGRISDGSADARTASTPSLADPSGSAGTGFPASAWLVTLWAGGTALVLAYLGVAFLGCRRVIRSSRPCTDPRIVSFAERLAVSVGLPRAPRVLVTDEVAVPAATGFVRPALLLPTHAAEWSDDTLRSVLLHELAHVRRRDLIAHALARVSCALYWPHPGVWMAARRLHSEREQACDDIVLAAGTEPTSYAACLLDLARTGRDGPRIPAAAVSMARPRELEGRLLSVLDGKARRNAPSRRAPVLTAALTLVVTLPLAGAHLPGDARARPDTDQRALTAEVADGTWTESGGTHSYAPETPARPQERGEAVDGERERGATATQGAETATTPRTSAGADDGPTVQTTVTPRAAADTGFHSLAGQRSRFLAETRALVVPILREALGEDPLVTDAVLDVIATSAAYPLWRTLDVRILVPDRFETGLIQAWGEGDSHLSIVRGPVERIEVVVSTRMGPLPESLLERVRGNLAASGHRVADADEPAMERRLRAAGAELERRWATILREEGTR